MSVDIPTTDFAPVHPLMPVAGIFDSGVGGLSVVRELAARQATIPFLYIADQAHAPYGPRSPLELCSLSEDITEFILEQKAHIVVIACNTASAAALYHLRKRYPNTHFVGMEPAVKPAAERTRTGKIAVIATQGTLEGEPYAGVLARYACNVDVYARACPEFVDLVEAGDVKSGTTMHIVKKTLQPLLDEGVDQIALACTHYSFLMPCIRKVCGSAAAVIDPAAAVASQVQRVAAALSRSPGHPSPPNGHWHAGFYTTGHTAKFSNLASELLAAKITARPLHWKMAAERRKLVPGPGSGK